MNSFSRIPYRRGHGCLNTFIIIDVRSNPGTHTNAFIAAAYTLLLQTGDDDVLILREAETATSVYMEVLEPDGSFASFCGNGARVVAAYLESQNGPGDYILVTQESSRAITAHGNGQYSVAMGKTLFDPRQSSLVASAHEHFSTEEGMLSFLEFKEAPEIRWYFSQTGEPHLITFASLSHEQLYELGMIINSECYRMLFPQGMSLNTVQILGNALISVITFERGVNRITKACGTGSTCSVAVASELRLVERKLVEGFAITVQTMGGTMVITYNHSEWTSSMAGPAELDPCEYVLTITEVQS